MNLLAFDTSTETLSVALRAGDRQWVHTGAGGAQASGALIPTVRQLLAQAGLALPSLQAIVFGCGPGSFTGLRTACSVAQGLGLGAGVPVLPVETLLAVAEEAREHAGARQVLAVLDARMDEVYAARYRHGSNGWQRLGEITLGPPERLSLEPGWTLAGNALAAYAGRLPAGPGALEVLPTAPALLRLAPGLLAAGQARPAELALPLYVRDKVAQTTQERAAARAAAAGQARITP